MAKRLTEHTRITFVDYDGFLNYCLQNVSSIDPKRTSEISLGAEN